MQIPPGPQPQRGFTSLPAITYDRRFGFVQECVKLGEFVGLVVSGDMIADTE
jgi:hypothetical protein